MPKNTMSEVKAIFGLNNSGFVKGMDEMRKNASSNSARMNKVFAKTEKSVDKLGKQVKKTRKRFLNWKTAAATVVGSGGLGLVIKKSLDAADAIAKNADAAALTTNQYQELTHAASLSGIAAENLGGSMVKFAKGVGEAKRETGPLVTFLKKYDEELLKAIQNTSTQEEALNIAADAIKNARTETDRATLAMTFFGKSGARMAIMMKGGAEGLNAVRAEAHELGLVIDEQLLRNAEKANDQMDILGRIIQTKITASVVEAAPQIQAMTESFTDNLPEIIEMVTSLANGLGWVADKVVSVKRGVDSFAKRRGEQNAKHMEKVGLIASVPDRFNTPERQKFIEEQMKLRGTGKPKKVEPPKLSSPTTVTDIADVIGVSTSSKADKEMDRLKKKAASIRKDFMSDADLHKEYLIELDELKLNSLLTEDEYQKAIQQSRDELLGTNEALKDMEGVMTGALEDALRGNISSWEDWGSSVLDILGDVALAQLKNSSLMSGGSSGGGLFSSLSSGIGSMLGSAFGGGGGVSAGDITWNGPRRAQGGPVSAGQAYLVGENAPELFVPKTDGYIHNKMPTSGGGNISVNNTFNISSGADGSVRAEITAMLPMIEKRTVAAVGAAIRRGGTLAQQVGARK